MASNLPLPIPPRTPTPPADDQHASEISSGIPIDRDSLSPLNASFPKGVMDFGSKDRLSPTKSSFNLSPAPEDTVSPIENGASDMTAAGPFNFSTTVMAKSPVVKSVSPIAIPLSEYENTNQFSFRTLDNVAATSTSTVASHTRSSSSLPLAPP
jgi:hypothetical protein